MVEMATSIGNVEIGDLVYEELGRMIDHGAISIIGTTDSQRKNN